MIGRQPTSSQILLGVVERAQRNVSKHAVERLHQRRSRNDLDHNPPLAVRVATVPTKLPLLRMGIRIRDPEFHGLRMYR